MAALLTAWPSTAAHLPPEEVAAGTSQARMYMGAVGLQPKAQAFSWGACRCREDPLIFEMPGLGVPIYVL